ncbi:MAG: hypothetical protein K0S33_1880 [Bacteroidetes bacterium]|jgi:hypothetical protein|nr:hypothetical protein [Bacteroidota bacterium]
MTKKELIDNYYKNAVKGLTEEILQDKDLWYSYVLNLPFQERIVYLVGILNQQILNGGFHQYFFNSYGQFGYLTLDILEKIGAKETANILEKALNAVNSENFSMEEFKTKVFKRQIKKIIEFDEKLGDYLNELDKEYDSSQEDLEELCLIQ